MRFDNKHFEQNVSTTMSTLDKLKQKLHLDGAVKGLDNVNNAAKNVNMSGLGAGVEAVSAKFSALQVMGVTALANITNSAVNAGKRIVKSLTIEPVTTGFNEYELKMGSIQTIMAGTGEKLETVNKYLEELNEYSDKTIYSFKDMTSNIGKFTNAGVSLEDAVMAIKGISNEAAVSGANANEASRAMYNFSQALSAGFVKLIDWKSIENANMATKEFKEQLIESAVAVGTLKKGADGMYDIVNPISKAGATTLNATKNFNDSLQNQWMTTEVLVRTLREYADENTEIGKKASAAATEVKTFSMMMDTLKESAQSGWARTWELIVGDFEEAKTLFTTLSKVFGGIIDGMSDFRNRILEIALDFTKPWTTMIDKIGNIKKAVSNVKDATKTLKYFQDVVTKVWRGDFNNNGDNPDRRDLLKKAGYDPRVVQDLVNKGYKYKLTVEDIEASHKKFGLTLKTTKKETKETAESLDKLTDKKLKDAGLTEDEIALYRAMEKEADRLGITVSELADDMTKNDGRTMLIDSLMNFGNIITGIAKAAKQAFVDIFNPPGAEEIGIRLYGLIKSLKDFSEKLRLTDKETGKLNANGEKIARTLKGVFAILKIVTTIIGGGLKIAFKVVSSILSYFNLNILDVTAAIGDAAVKVGEWFDSLFDISGVLDKVVPAIERAVKAIGEWFDAFKTSEGMQNAIKYINEIGTSISEWWANLKNAEDLPKTIADGIVNFFSNIPSIISNVCSNIWDAFTGSFSDKVSANPLDGLIDGIRNGFGIAGQTIVELGKILLEKLNTFLSAKGFETISEDSIAGLVNGLKSGATNVWNAALDIGKQILQSIKEFLGIHSPSTEMEEVGTNTIDGFVLGIQNGGSKVWDAIKGMFEPILAWIKELDFGAIVASVIGIFGVSTVHKLSNALEAFSAPFEGIGDMLGNLGEALNKTYKKPIKKILNNAAKTVKSFNNVLNGVAFDIKANAIKTLAEALLMVVGAFIVLGIVVKLVKPATMWNAIGMIFVLSVILVGLAFALNKISSVSASVDFKKGIDLKGLTTGLTGIGIALLLMASTVVLLGKLDPEQAKQGFLRLAGLVVAIGAIFAVFGILVKGKTAQNIDKFGKTMTKLGVALLLMAVVAKMLGRMDPTALDQGIGAIAAFGIIMTGLVWTTELISDSKNVGKIGDTLLKMAAAIAIMAIVAKMLGGMDQGELIRGGLAIVVFSGIIVGLMAATRLIVKDKRVEAIGDALLKIGAAIGIMGLVVKMLGGMDTGALIKGGVAVIAFSGIIVGLMAATRLIAGDKRFEGIGTTLLAVSGAIAIMALTAFMLSMVSWEGFAKGVAMITIFSGIIVGLMAATRLLTSDPNGQKMGPTLLTIAGAIGILALIAVLLGLVPLGKLIKGTAIVIVLSAVMAGLIAVTKLAKGCMGNIIAITAAIAVMAGAVYLLSTLEPDKLTGATLAMTILLGMFAVVIAASSLAGTAMVTLIVITGVIAVLAGILYLLSGLPVDSTMGTATALSILLLAMSAALAILTIIGPAAVLAIPAAAALAAVIGIIAGVLLALGALSKIDGFNELIADGGTTLSLIGTAIGAFIGSIVKGFASEVLQILPMFGVALSGFMVGVQPFIAGVKLVDESVLKGAGILTAAILALSVADFISGVATLGGLGLIGLGLQLSGFMAAAMPFITTAATITPEMMAGVKALAGTILILTAADLLDGLKLFGSSSIASFASELPLLGQGLKGFSDSLGEFTDDQLATVNCAAKAVKALAQASSEIPNAGGLLGMLVGENDLRTFASQFPDLGTGLRGFLDNVGEFTDAQVTTVNCAAQAIKTLAQASSEIPNSGGWLGQIVGENDLSTFASQFPDLGTGLRGFLDNVGEFTDTQVATVDSAAQAIKLLAEASSEIPNSGGWLAQIVGDNDLGTFAEQFPSLGEGIRGFLDNVGDIDATSISAIEAGAEAVSILAKAATNIPNEGGWISKIVGDNNLGTFASNFPTLGEGIAGFVEKLGTFTEAQVATVKTGVSAIDALSKLANVDLSAANKYLTNFGSKLPGFALDLGSFCTNMPSQESMSGASSTIKTLLASVKDIGNANSGCLSTFASNLKKVSKEAVDKFIGAFTSDTAKTDIKKAAKTLGEKAVEGAESKEDSMETAGKDLGKGLVKGIEAKYDDAYNAGFKLGQKAVQGEKDGQASNSPSKLTIQAGKWIGEGLVIGMGRMARQVYNAGYGLGDTATNTITSAVSRVADAINTDIDAQPTIRPIMDLSDVRAGTSAIGSMLNMGSTIGVRANIGSISSMMNARSMGATNNDVVSAIDKLRKDLSNVGGTTYNVNGVTYDDGSNVSSAIESLVRYAKIERRV
jgi:hypothetical protein